MAAGAVKLEEMYLEAARLCLAAGVPIDGEPCGAVHRWVAANVRFRPDTEFFIVFGICAAMADLKAQAEGYRNQAHRAAALMRKGAGKLPQT